MPLLLTAFSNVLPQVICGQPIGRECDTLALMNAPISYQHNETAAAAISVRHQGYTNLMRRFLARSTQGNLPRD